MKNEGVKIDEGEICRLDRFWLKVIEEDYDVLDIDGNFRRRSEGANILLVEERMDEVVEGDYDILDGDFIDLREEL
ncbi:hypothetical protein [Staphylococcus saprophyticus]|uniref:hypothetical protein n=1 Tax=Staphylococcus saprophyticus TaxID=29385 RepID=UPI0012471323|nr:hypothetical protein [Staphylococcus saprophyticus]